MSPPIRSFGRIKARALKPRQAALFETLLPKIALPAEGRVNLDDLFGALPPPLRGRDGEGGDGGALAGTPANTPTPGPSPQGGGERVRLPSYILEIGFGGGEHLVAQACAHPEAGFIGVEPFLNGVGSCLRHVEEANARNIRIHNGDARDVLARLPDASLALVYILFPDPWPKARHHKRRLIQPDFIAELARVLQPGGDVRFATDWANYAAWTLEHFTRSPAFEWRAERPADWRSPWKGHVMTRYEQKKLGDCAPVFLRFGRRDLRSEALLASAGIGWEGDLDALPLDEPDAPGG